MCALYLHEGCGYGVGDGAQVFSFPVAMEI